MDGKHCVGALISRTHCSLVLQGKRRIAKLHVVDSTAAVIRLLGYYIPCGTAGRSITLCAGLFGEGRVGAVEIKLDRSSCSPRWYSAADVPECRWPRSDNSNRESIIGRQSGSMTQLHNYSGLHARACIYGLCRSRRNAYKYNCGRAPRLLQNLHEPFDKYLLCFSFLHFAHMTISL